MRDVIGVRVMWWRVDWMFARATFTDTVNPRRVKAGNLMLLNWKRAHRATLRRMNDAR